MFFGGREIWNAGGIKINNIGYIYLQHKWFDIDLYANGKLVYNNLTADKVLYIAVADNNIPFSMMVEY